MMEHKLILGLSMRYLGYHAAGWRMPEANPAGTASLAHFRDVARRAEQTGFDFVFLADGLAVRARDEPPGARAQSSQVADLEPLTLLSALAASTEHIGLIATASTTYSQPYMVARQFASLDRISDGRAGWNVVTSWSDAEARNFGLPKNPDPATRYKRAEEFVDVVSGLWRSWEDGALVHDKERAVFIDPARLHALNHAGPEFSVEGPLSVPPSPQGCPLIVQAGSSPAGMALAARTADIAYTVPQNLDEAIAFRQDIRARAERFGRDPDSIRVLPGIVPFIGRDASSAKTLYQEMGAYLPEALARSYLQAQMGDLGDHTLDDPVPEPGADMPNSIARTLALNARREGLTLGQLAHRIASGFGARIVTGSGVDIAEEMALWHAQGAADGFNICLPLLPSHIDLFAEFVMPELQRRDLVTPMASGPLRQRLGLPGIDAPCAVNLEQKTLS